MGIFRLISSYSHPVFSRFHSFFFPIHSLTLIQQTCSESSTFFGALLLMIKTWSCPLAFCGLLVLEMSVFLCYQRIFWLSHLAFKSPLLTLTSCYIFPKSELIAFSNNNLISWSLKLLFFLIFLKCLIHCTLYCRVWQTMACRPNPVLGLPVFVIPHF